MFAVSLDEHVAGASRRDGLNEDFVAGAFIRTAALDHEGSFSGAGVVQIPAYYLLNRLGESDHRRDSLSSPDLADAIST
jgi:hypothetical protein